MVDHVTHTQIPTDKMPQWERSFKAYEMFEEDGNLPY